MVKTIFVTAEQFKNYHINIKEFRGSAKTCLPYVMFQ